MPLATESTKPTDRPIVITNGAGMAWDRYAERFRLDPAGLERMVGSLVEAPANRVRNPVEKGVAMWNPSVPQLIFIVVEEPAESVIVGIVRSTAHDNERPSYQDARPKVDFPPDLSGEALLRVAERERQDRLAKLRDPDLAKRDRSRIEMEIASINSRIRASKLQTIPDKTGEIRPDGPLQSEHAFRRALWRRVSKVVNHRIGDLRASDLGMREAIDRGDVEDQLKGVLNDLRGIILNNLGES